jgi:signal transduction histidine kinase
MRLVKVLIVDDEPEVLTLLGIILRKRGYSPVECLTGQEAMEQIQKRCFYLGLIDVVLPDMDGLEIIKEAKKKNPLSEMIVMTGCNRIDIAIKAVKYQAYDFLLKPIESELLYCSLDRAKEMINLRLRDLLHKRNLERMVEERSQRLIQAEKQAIIGNSIQGIVHNILNPLTVIAGRVELLKAELDQISKKKDENVSNINVKRDFSGNDILETLKKFGQDITAIYQNSQKIFYIVDNILKKYTLEKESTPSCIDINNLIIQEMEFFKSDLYFKHQVKKSYDLDPSLGKVNMVYSHLSQVLDNLVKNGIEAMYESQKKEITIKTYQDEKLIYLSVKDTGIGIPNHLKDKVFEPFFSTKASLGDNTKKQRVGYGLGLHSCLELLKPYGGDIWLESKQDLGSTLTIVLPQSISSSDEIDEKLMETGQAIEKQEINIKGQLLNFLAEGKI